MSTWSEKKAETRALSAPGANVHRVIDLFLTSCWVSQDQRLISGCNWNETRHGRRVHIVLEMF